MFTSLLLLLQSVRHSLLSQRESIAYITTTTTTTTTTATAPGLVNKFKNWTFEQQVSSKLVDICLALPWCEKVWQASNL
jgi:hypothetical protein